MNSAPTSIPRLADNQPVWKVSPGGARRYLNSVAVSADGSAVVGGSDDAFLYAFPP